MRDILHRALRWLSAALPAVIIVLILYATVTSFT